MHKSPSGSLTISSGPQERLSQRDKAEALSRCRSAHLATCSCSSLEEVGGPSDELLQDLGTTASQEAER